MGTRLAPSLANLFMGNLEGKMLAGAPHKPKLFLRFIDDIFLIFEGNELELETFISYKNSYHPTNKFTAEHSKKEVVFLDTRVKINPQGQLYTDL